MFIWGSRWLCLFSFAVFLFILEKYFGMERRSRLEWCSHYCFGKIIWEIQSFSHLFLIAIKKFTSLIFLLMVYLLFYYKYHISPQNGLSSCSSIFILVKHSSFVILHNPFTNYPLVVLELFIIFFSLDFTLLWLCIKFYYGTFHTSVIKLLILWDHMAPI